MEIQKVFTDHSGERLYSVRLSESELIFYQKEFGIRDLFHPDIKRSLKKYIGRARKGMTLGLDISIVRDLEKYGNVSANFPHKLNDLKVLNKESRNNLYKKAHEMNAKVHGIPSPLVGQASSSTVSTRVPLIKQAAEGRKSILGEDQEKLFDHAIRQGGGLQVTFLGPKLKGTDLKKAKKRFRKLTKDVNESRADNLILHEAKAGDSVLAHELGHIGNEKEGNFIRKKINEIANSQRVRSELNSDSGIIRITGNPLKKFIEGKLVMAEERSASKRGFNYMKEAGYSPRDIEQAKKLLLDKGGAIDTYKHITDARWKAALRNKIAIPSNKGIPLM